MGQESGSRATAQLRYQQTDVSPQCQKQSSICCVSVSPVTAALAMRVSVHAQKLAFWENSIWSCIAVAIHDHMQWTPIVQRYHKKSHTVCRCLIFVVSWNHLWSVFDVTHVWCYGVGINEWRSLSTTTTEGQYVVSCMWTDAMANCSMVLGCYNCQGRERYVSIVWNTSVLASAAC